MVDTNNRVWAASTPGKRHDPADVRHAEFKATGGATGLVAAGGGGVGLTPGTPMSVRLDPCSVVVRSAYAARSDESYSFTVKSPQDVAIRTTGSGGGRTDVVGFVVSDPILEGKTIAETDAEGNVVPGSEGLDPNEYDYWGPHVFENVPSSAASDTGAFLDWVYDNNLVEGMAVPYAKVVQGANSTSLDGKVAPFFDVVLGRRWTHTSVHPVSRISQTRRATSYVNIGPELNFPVPSWATQATVVATVMGMFAAGQSSRGLLNALSMGWSLEDTNWDLDIIPGAGDNYVVRGTYVVAGQVVVPNARRGGVGNFQLRAQNVNQDTNFGVDEGSTILLQVIFEEDPRAIEQ